MKSGSLPLLLSAALSLVPLTLPAQIARLYVSTTGFLDKIRPGQSAEVDVVATNLGPDAAVNTVVTIEPQAGIPTRVTGTGVSCTATSTGFECTVGTVPPNGGVRMLHVSESLPPTLGVYRTELSVRSDTPTDQPSYKTGFGIEVSNDPDLVIALDGFLPSQLDPGQLLTNGLIVKNTSPFDAHDVVVIFSPLSGYTMTSGTYGAFTCTAAADGGTGSRCTTPILRAGETLTLKPEIRVNPSLEGGQLHFEATVISREADFKARDNRTGTMTSVAYRTFVVSNTADAGFGSLREALLQSATGCDYNIQPCKVAFNIAEPLPAAGWFTITPQSPLPAVTTSGLIIDGATQTAFSGDTNPLGPEVEISGRGSAAPNGLVLSRGIRVTLRQLAINGFAGYGLVVTGGGVAYQSILIEGNTIGANGRGIGLAGAESVSIVNNTINGNRRSGIFITSAIRTGISKNTIDGNGASGIFVGNDASDTYIDQSDISANGEFAVALAPQTAGAIVRATTMHDNGNFAIDVALDLRTPNVAHDRTRLPNTPVLTTAHYDEGLDVTVIKGTLTSDCQFCDLIVDLYASTTLGPNGSPQAERHLGSLNLGGYIPVIGPFTYTTKGNLTGQLITATNSRSAIPFGLARTGDPIPDADPQVYGTSELSDAVRVER